VAPESDDNPWHYKISWNPANVVNAGKAGAVYLEKGKKIELDYRKIFEDAETIHVPELGNFAWYPNRNSMDYIPLYGLENCETFLRTTLRHPDYCIGWQAVIVAGLTNADNESNIKEFRAKSFNDWFLFSLHLYTDAKNFNDFLVKYIPKNQHEIVIKLFNYLGITSDDAIPEGFHTSADILRYLLDTRLQLHENDKDMIVMFHEITYEINDEIKELKSTLVVKGDDQLHTAMAKTVGLPLAAAAKLILNKTITAKGLHIPTAKEIYEPILKELSKNGISFKEYS
jgi:saccharopine dehydrogenase (NADP+, L-glutamate forming)